MRGEVNAPKGSLPCLLRLAPDDSFQSEGLLFRELPAFNHPGFHWTREGTTLPTLLASDARPAPEHDALGQTGDQLDVSKNSSEWWIAFPEGFNPFFLVLFEEFTLIVQAEIGRITGGITKLVVAGFWAEFRTTPFAFSHGMFPGIRASMFMADHAVDD